MGSKQDISVESVQDQTSVAIGSFFKGFNVPNETSFELYKKKNSDGEFVVHGENSRLEYEGSTDSTASDSVQYVVGVYDPSKKNIKLYKAPLVQCKVISKSSKKLKGPKIKSNETRMSILRNALGEAFGTKKAKKAIMDLEKNRVDADKLVESAIDIVDSVKAASKDLPSKADLDEMVSNDRPTPLANVEATDVEEIYPINNIIPKREWQFIRVGPIIKEEDQEQKLEMFPYTKSQYISKKLSTLSQSNNMTKLQLLYYLSLLLGVYDNRRANNKDKLLEKLNSPPEILIDGVLDRFTISRPGQFGKSKDRSYFIDPQNEDRLLCFILTIILHLDNFIVEISPLAQELGLKPSKVVSLFRILGCIVKGATVSQAEAFGIPKSAASTYKIASLKVPFKLPEMVRRGRGPRR
ncbi:hypothetical protein Kpol_2000p33 [Vanderwaltozyma polyspora DSM 70294]|uniref:DNA-directed RNA polymerase I subunit RPA49 n=1 Tax=Vanderwaltozyma polyspora (strain ATCC 22028 / DSM 70294 / BCRC 21397 / CBS 2163 / NBRC 10782 / NRRL Y-8283 / UCD 57-17) TaxID=436907 RepID=A7TF43_VANPO|nr:uncharacterized protein Kpol_2000p33 [Vanderwaltozyma polyspora DSM 70294]EDO19068.1 hypothetical protein Kpol_2000p33 [Vanderwaltozyma polyspora DSM 70294]